MSSIVNNEMYCNVREYEHLFVDNEAHLKKINFPGVCIGLIVFQGILTLVSYSMPSPL